MGLGLVGMALFFNKIGELSAGMLAVIIGIYLYLVFIPAGTARSLAHESKRGLRRLMIWANWSLIALWALSFIGILFSRAPATSGILSALVFAAPAWMNICALDSIEKGVASVLDRRWQKPVL